jgi:uncharacterized coiled-coil DUF342 family protein
MEKALEYEMYNYFTQLNDAEKESVIQMLKVFLNSRNAASEHTSIEQYNQELQEAEAEFQRGEYISHEEFVKLIKKW